MLQPIRASSHASSRLEHAELGHLHLGLGQLEMEMRIFIATMTTCPLCIFGRL